INDPMGAKGKAGWMIAHYRSITWLPPDRFVKTHQIDTVGDVPDMKRTRTGHMFDENRIGRDRPVIALRPGHAVGLQLGSGNLPIPVEIRRMNHQGTHGLMPANRAGRLSRRYGSAECNGSSGQ